jgi:branched-chain amino acid transport system permease protein
LAIGVVMTHRGAGVVNIAHGALAMYVAYVFSGLRTEGTLFLPPLPNPLALVEVVAGWLRDDPLRLPRWPTELTLSSQGIPTSAALPISLTVAAVLGYLVHLLVFRPLRKAPALGKLVASVGLMLTLQATVVLRFGANVRPVAPIIPNEPVRIIGSNVARDRLLLALLVIVAAVALHLFYSRTRLGIATRAAAENGRTAVLVGLSPDALGAVNWVLATVLAGLVGILASQITQLEPSQLTLMIVPALGAALVGRLSSFGLAAAAGLSIGAIQSLVLYLQTHDWYPQTGRVPLPGVAEAVPFLVVVTVLFLRGERLPTRINLARGHLPRSPLPRRVAAHATLTTVVAATVLVAFPHGWRQPVTNSVIGCLMCLSLVVVTGFVGQVSLAQVALAGTAGFVLSKLAIEHDVPFPLAPLAGALAATALGLLVAIPALRIRGVNLAVATLAAALAIEQLLLRNPAWGGGTSGSQVDAPSLFGIEFGPANPVLFHDSKLPARTFTLFCLAVAVALGVLVSNLRRSTTGRHMLAVRANERAAAAVGVDVARTKLLAFAVAAFVAGIAGALYAYSFQSVSASRFGTFAGIVVVAFAYLGGISSVVGAVIGGLLVSQGVFFYVLDRYIGVGSEYELLLGGVGLLLTATLNPDGIAGAGHGLMAQLRRRKRVATVNPVPHVTAAGARP